MAARKRKHEKDVATPNISSVPVPRRRGWGTEALLTLCLAVAVAIAFKTLSPRTAAPFQLRPSSLPKVKDSSLFDDAYREELFWGTYRPGFYCGVRSRVQQPLTAGVMWASPVAAEWWHLRHEASNSHGLQTFGWHHHDLRSFGEQVAMDGPLNISTTFLKRPSSGYGGDWAISVHVAHNERAGAAEYTNKLADMQPVYVYLGQEYQPEQGDPMGLQDLQFEATSEWGSTELQSSGGVLLASGVSAEVGQWGAVARLQGGSYRDQQNVVSAAKFRVPQFHKMHDHATEAIKMRYMSLRQQGREQQFDGSMEHVAMDDANVVLLQVQMRLPFTLELAFTSALPRTSSHAAVESASKRQASLLLGSAGETVLATKRQDFQQRFQAATAGPDDQGLREVSMRAVAESLGSMGYFYGSSIVQMDDGSSQLSQPQPLFSAVPSRSFFPRGFLWDEGFHQLLLQHWDLQASCEALAHWLDLMNADGWIPREQILGDEARSRVPDEYVAQLPQAANPPTLFLPIMKLAQSLAKNASAQDGVLLTGLHASSIARERWTDFLQRAWPRLLLWFRWFDRLQAGPVAGSYRWRGRSAGSVHELNPKTLASGLDDYPRASHPSEKERHLDLRCWMAFAVDALIVIGESVGAPHAEMQALRAQRKKLQDYAQLKALHWDTRMQSFLDWGMHTEDVALARSSPSQDPVRIVTGEAARYQYVPHFGYNSLFPLALQLVPWASTDMQLQLQQLQDPQLLWTQFGLRSLAQASSIYHKHNTLHDAPYWRGAIWINMNFLVLRSLRACSRSEGPSAAQCEEVHGQLRDNLLSNIVRQFQSPAESFLWENYDDVDGHGKGTHPFGWTCLLALIALEQY